MSEREYYATPKGLLILEILQALMWLDTKRSEADIEIRDKLRKFFWIRLEALLGDEP